MAPYYMELPTAKQSHNKKRNLFQFLKICGQEGPQVFAFC